MISNSEDNESLLMKSIEIKFHGYLGIKNYLRNS